LDVVETRWAPLRSPPQTIHRPLEPSHHVARSNRVHQAPGEDRQHLVAHSAAECVVDVLEMIEVKCNHRESAPPPRLKMLQLVQQATPVDQAGEVVAVGLADELVLRSFALGDVL
jgi:hypothetical protein